ncbi:MAG: hypothetical protein N2689_15840 [Verrucomicrobiae bacterium]|nr:hypothetical protein [Verrucomicrobiae bacterium]
MPFFVPLVPAQNNAAGSFPFGFNPFGKYRSPAIRTPSLQMITSRFSTLSGNGERG